MDGVKGLGLQEQLGGRWGSREVGRCSLARELRLRTGKALGQEASIGGSTKD